jgi:hypothetical protein
MREAPDIVPELTTDAVRVLVVRVSAASRVTTVPVDGKTAVDDTPVPPSKVGRVPVTAAVLERFTALKVGAPPRVGTVRTCPGVPAAELMVPEPLPISTELLGTLATPRPPFAIPKTPLIDEVGKVGMSPTVSVVPYTALPFSSTASLA